MAQRLAAGTLWSLAGAVGGRVFTIVAAVVVARVLGKSAFGKLGIIQSTLMMFSTVAGLGLGSAAMIYVARYCKQDPLRAGRVVVLTRSAAQITGLIASVSLYIAAPWLAQVSLGAAELSPLLRISAFALLFIAINGVQTSILSGLQAFDLNAKCGVITCIGSAACLVVGSWAGGLAGGAWGLLGGYVFTAGITYLFVKHRAKRDGIPLHASNCWAERRILYSVSLPAFVCNLLIVPTSWVCNAILVNRPEGFGEMALVSMSNQWRTVLMFLPQVLASAMTPILASLHGQGDTRAYRKTVMLNLLVNAGSTGLACAVIAGGSHWIIRAYGREFEGGETVLILTCVSGMLMALNGVVGTEMTGRGRIWLGTLFCTLVSSALLLFTWLLVPRYGALGLAWAYVLAYLLHSLWQGVYLWSVLRPMRQLSV